MSQLNSVSPGAAPKGCPSGWARWEGPHRDFRSSIVRSLPGRIWALRVPSHLQNSVQCG